MEIQGKENKLTDIEKNFYFFGATGLVGVFLFTIIFGNMFSPLRLLQLRMFFVGMGLGYFLAIYSFLQRLLQEKPNDIEANQKDIIIYFNGKELGRR